MHLIDTKSHRTMYCYNKELLLVILFKEFEFSLDQYTYKRTLMCIIILSTIKVAIK